MGNKILDFIDFVARLLIFILIELDSSFKMCIFYDNSVVDDSSMTTEWWFQLSLDVDHLIFFKKSFSHLFGGIVHVDTLAIELSIFEVAIIDISWFEYDSAEAIEGPILKPSHVDSAIRVIDGSQTAKVAT